MSQVSRGCDIEWFTQTHMYANKTWVFIFLAYICGIQWFTQREEKRTQSKRCSKFRGKRAEKRPQTKRSSKFRGNGVLNPMTVLRTEMHAMSKYLRSKGLDSASKRAKALSRLALHVVSHEFPMEDWCISLVWQETCEFKLPRRIEETRREPLVPLKFLCWSCLADV